MQHRSVFCDAASIKKAGIENYLNNYFWPVNQSDFENILKYMYSSYNSIALKIKNEELFNLAIIESTLLFNRLETLLHFNYVREFSEENKIKLYTSDVSGVKEFLYPDFKEISLYYKNIYPSTSKITLMLRRLVRNLVFNRHLGPLKTIKSFFCKSQVVGFGHFDDLKINYLKHRKLYCDNRDWVDFVKFDQIDEDAVGKKTEEFMSILIYPFLDKLKDSNTLFTKNLDFSKLKNSWKKRCFDLIKIYDSFKFETLPEEILVTNSAKPISKLIITKFQSMGVKTYGFHHGNMLGNKCHRTAQFIGKSCCKRFIMPSRGIAEAYKNNYSEEPLEKIIKPTYVSADTSFYLNLFNDKKNKYQNVKKNSAMLIGTPANIFRYTDELGQFFYFKFALEFKIISLLKKHGMHVVYKAHPDRQKEIRGLFENYVDEYVVTPFEKIWHKYDNYIFTDTASSTFGFSIATQKKIILLENNKESKNKKVDELVSSRIFKVKADFNSDLKFSFNEKDLIDSIKAKNYKDFSIVKEHLS